MSNAERLNQNVLNVISVCQRILVVAMLEKTYEPVGFYFVLGIVHHLFQPQQLIVGHYWLLMKNVIFIELQLPDYET